MKQLYDARRATDEEKALVHGTMDYVVTMGDTIVCHLPLLGVASTMANILNQEYAMWEKQENARIAELEAALEANKRSSFLVWDTTIHEMRGKLQSIYSTATYALKKAGDNG